MIHILSGMVHLLKGKDNKPQSFCPHCNNPKIIQDRHPNVGKIQYFCKSCKKYFSEDTLKGYPPSNISFPLIAYFLYFRRKVPEFSNMRKFRKFVNFWLNYLRVTDDEVSRQTVHHWIKNYEKYLDKVINFPEARDYIRQWISEALPIPVHKPIPYGRALKILEKKFGKAYCVGLVRHDPVFFQELVDIISRYGVFGWEFLEAGFRGGSVGYRSLPSG